MKRLLSTILLTLGTLTASAAPRPNIVVIVTDDHGYADLGVQGILKDVKTPHLDDMAKNGVLCKAGYVTAPQCSPSRAGILSGRHQQKFGFDNNQEGPLPLEEITIAERLKKVGYITGMVGKWHVELNPTSLSWAQANNVPTYKTKRGRKLARVNFEMMKRFYPQNQGFDQFFKGELTKYWANYGLDGKALKQDGEWIEVKDYRLDIQTDAALAFIERNHQNPFFLYLGYFGPHVPLDATEKYLSRFPGDMPVRRRYGLAMVSAIDDGVGRIRAALRRRGVLENTLIFFLGDNGAPLKLTMVDAPVKSTQSSWDGSRNDPWSGEKGTLIEGGIRVPYLVSWPAVLPRGSVYNEPVISLDVAATIMAAVGQAVPAELDGEDIVPRLTGAQSGERTLHWRFWNQSAIRRGKWKYIKIGDGREWLFDLESDKHEHRNLLGQHPEKAQELKNALKKWCNTLQPKGISDQPLNIQEQRWYDHFLK